MGHCFSLASQASRPAPRKQGQGHNDRACACARRPEACDRGDPRALERVSTGTGPTRPSHRPLCRTAPSHRDWPGWWRGWPRPEPQAAGQPVRPRSRAQRWRPHRLRAEPPGARERPKQKLAKPSSFSCVLPPASCLFEKCPWSSPRPSPTPSHLPSPRPSPRGRGRSWSLCNLVSREGETGAPVSAIQVRALDQRESPQTRDTPR